MRMAGTEKSNHAPKDKTRTAPEESAATRLNAFQLMVASSSSMTLLHWKYTMKDRQKESVFLA